MVQSSQTYFHLDTFEHSTSTDGLVSVLASGNSAVVITLASTTSMLDNLDKHLTRSRTRVMRVSPPLDLSDMMDQVVASNAAAPEETTIETGFRALTVPGDGYNRVALLVSEAHLMSASALRYLDFVFRMAPDLQVVLFGQSGLADLLALRGFTTLRARFALHLNWSGKAAVAHAVLGDVLADASPAADPVSRCPEERTVPQPLYRISPLRVAASTAFVTSVVLVLFLSTQLSHLNTPIAFAPQPIAEIAGVDTDPEQTALATNGLQADKQSIDDSAETSGAVAAEKSDPTPQAIAAIPAPSIFASSPVVQEPEQPVSTQSEVLQVPSEELSALPLTPNQSEASQSEVSTGNTAAAVQPGSVIGPSRFPIAPPIPHRAQPVRSDRIPIRIPIDRQGVRCRTISLRIQVGDAPTDAELSFLRNGCR